MSNRNDYAETCEVTDRVTFAVHEVIGTLEVSEYGQGDPPNVAAFRLIDRLDRPGTYGWTLPAHFGHECRVQVTIESVKLEEFPQP